MALQTASLENGSTLAADRETDKISFTTRMGDGGEAFLQDIVDMSNIATAIGRMENKAAEARSYDSDGAVAVTISGNTFTVRSDNDIEAIAQALVEKISAAKFSLAR